MKKALSALLLTGLMVFSVIAMTACEKKSEATVYGKVHNHYVGIATVTTSGDKVASCKFDEVLLPYNWADVTKYESSVTDKDNKGDTLANKVFAKYIQLDNVNYELQPKGEPAKNYPVYKAIGTGEADLYTYILKDGETGKWYAETVAAGKFAIMKKDGENFVKELDAADISEASGYGAKLLKSEGGYWVTPITSGSNPTVYNWADNIKFMENFIVDNNFGAYNPATEYTKETAAGSTFKVGEVDTKATMGDFNDYMRLAYSAYQKALGK